MPGQTVQLPWVVGNDCFRSLLPILIDAGLDRLVVESCDQDIQDRRVIREMLDKAGSTDRVTYLHSAPDGTAALDRGHRRVGLWAGRGLAAANLGAGH